MSGIFGVVSKADCAETLLYGTDYHSHLGTEYGGMAVLGREFTRHIHDLRQSQFKSKFFDAFRHIEGNSIVICEDSIVRGTQPKNFTIKKLWDGGATQIHARPACPPLMFPCIFNLSTRSIGELAARKAIRALEGHDLADVSPYIDHSAERHAQMVDWIARDLGVTTLRYQTVDDMVKAIGLPREKLCLYCWTGQCPKAACPKAAFDIAEANKPARRRQPVDSVDQQKLW